MGQASSQKYEVKSIKKSVLKIFSDPEVRKGIGSALIFLGIVLGIMGIIFTAVAFGSPKEAAHSFPYAGPCLIVLTAIFFVIGMTLVRHEYIGCFKNGETEFYSEKDTFMIFCCFCHKALPLYKNRKTDERTDSDQDERLEGSGSNASKLNNDKDKTIKLNVAGSLASFSSLRNFKVHPIDTLYDTNTSLNR